MGETMRYRIARAARCAVIATAVCAAGCLSLGSATALAAGEAHPKVGEFDRSGPGLTEPFSNPNGIAVDEATGDVYVADIGTNTVYKFDASGKPVDFSSLGGNELTGTPAEPFSFPASEEDTPAAIAVDNSTSAADGSRGDLYVMDAGHGVVDKFSPSGAYLGQITGPFAGPLLGLGVDGKGELRVGYGQGFGESVDLFDSSAGNNFLSVIKVSSYDEKWKMTDGFAVSPAGDQYLLGSCGCLEKFGANGEALGRVDTKSDVAVAIDPVTGHLYVDDQSSVGEWDAGGMNGQVEDTAPGAVLEDVASGSLVSSFGSSQLSGTSGQGGIAVDGAIGQIYVSNPADGKVYVYGSAAPDVTVGEAGEVTKTAATLEGSVNPRGSAVTSCKFEYEATTSSDIRIPVTVFGHSAPCEPAQPGAGTRPVQVRASVAGLAEGVLYHFRLVAQNAQGTSFSDGMFATRGPGFGIKPGGFEVSFLNEDGTPDTQAGSHPFEMTTNIVYNTKVVRREATADSRYVTEPDGNVKDVIVDLPPGLVGDPNATPTKCTLRELDEEEGATSSTRSCPPESLVGYLEVEFGDQPSLIPNLREAVYNMAPPHGVAAQFGAHFIVPNAFINSEVLAGENYPVQSSSLDIGLMDPIISTRLIVFGSVNNCVKAGATGGKYSDAGCHEAVAGKGGEYEKEPGGKPFLTLPTACNGPLKSKLAVDSYQQQGVFKEASAVTRDASGQAVGLTGCANLKFPPTITVTPDTTDASTSSGLTVGVHVSQKAALNPEGLAESALRDTTVTLPEGVSLNPSGSDGLEACSEGLIGYEGKKKLNPEYEPEVEWTTFTPNLVSSLVPGVSFCPNGSKIGTVKIETPLLSNPLEGAVYLATQNANPFGSLVSMYLVAEDPVSGTLIKLAGEVSLSATGQIVTTFKNTPDLPFENLELHFFGGERAPLSTPSHCGAYTTEAVFTPWDGNGPVHSTSSFEINHGPHGGPCPGASLPFNPSLNAGVINNQAGASSPLSTTIMREDGNQDMQSVSLHMPLGVTGLLSGVKLCPEAQANAGTCGPESLIGETTVAAGVGSDPVSVKGGRVYLTEKYRGSPFGLSIVDPVKAGPFDLEHDTSKPATNMPACDCLVVRAKIEVNPLTAALTVTTDPSGPHAIPHIVDGIPVQIQKVNVTINRPGFMVNPTSCAKMSLTGTIGSDEGATAAVGVPFQVANCASLKFKPSFSASTSAHTSRQNGASLHVLLTYPNAPQGTQANIKSVHVELPKALPSRLSTLNHACPDSVFNQNPASCPAQSKVGFAKAVTPILPVPMEGPAYFVSHGGQKFPELIMVLQGYGITLDLAGETFISKAGITSSTFKTVPDVPVGSFELTLPEGKFSALAANKNLCTAGLVMPTKMTGQNGAVLEQKTKIAVSGCKPAIRVLRHRVRGSKATILVQVPSAGTLVATGKGIRRSVKGASKAKVVTIAVTLTARDRRILAKHPRQHINAKITLRFLRKHAAPLTAHVRLLMG